ncbi:MAG: carbon-nitrogen hydrolase family protein [Verrucomicrobiota bacterium]
MKKTILPLAVCLAASAYAQNASTPPVTMEKKPGQLNVAVVSMKSVYSDTPDAAENAKNIQANIGRHLYFIDKLAAQGAEFIGFPEASINGYHYSPNMTWLKLDGPEMAAIQKKAKEMGVYVGVGIAEVDPEGKHWEAQAVIGPDGKIAGVHRKNWLTKEKGFIEASTDHNVFDVKGTKMGIAICADGTDFRNLKALADGGAKIIYGPHANTTGGTTEGWYKFRSRWVGPFDETATPSKVADDSMVDMPAAGWIAGLKVYAILNNHAGLYNPDFGPPAGEDKLAGWASGTLIIGPDGAILAQKPPSSSKTDTAEFISTFSIPLGS